MSDTPPISQAMIELYDRFTHIGGSRRDLLDGLARLAGGVAAASAILPLIEARADAASLTSEDNGAIIADRVTYAGAAGRMMSGYLVAPGEGQGPRPQGDGHP